MNVRILESIGRRERELSEYLLRTAYYSLQETHRFEVGQLIHACGILYCRDRCLEGSPPVRNGFYFAVPHIPSRQIICCFRCYRAGDDNPGGTMPGRPSGEAATGNPSGETVSGEWIFGSPSGFLTLRRRSVREGWKGFPDSARTEEGMTWEEYLTGRIRPVSCPPEDTGPVLAGLSDEVLSSVAHWRKEYEAEWGLREKVLP